MKRPLEITPELRAKAEELQAKFDALFDEIEKLPLQLTWCLDAEEFDGFARVVDLMHNSEHYGLNRYLYADKKNYVVTYRGLGEEELESRKQKDL